MGFARGQGNRGSVPAYAGGGPRWRNPRRTWVENLTTLGPTSPPDARRLRFSGQKRGVRAFPPLRPGSCPSPSWEPPVRFTSPRPSTRSPSPGFSGRMASRTRRQAGVTATTAPLPSWSVFDRRMVSLPDPSAQRSTSSPGRDRRWSRRYRIHHRPKRGAPDRLKTPTIPILLGPTVVSAPCSSLRAFLPLQPSSTQEGDQRQARLKLGSTKVPQVRCNSLVPGTQSWREHGSCATLAESCSVTALCVS